MKNLSTTMHFTPRHRRFFGTQPFAILLTFCAFVPQNDTFGFACPPSVREQAGSPATAGNLSIPTRKFQPDSSSLRSGGDYFHINCVQTEKNRVKKSR